MEKTKYFPVTIHSVHESHSTFSFPEFTAPVHIYFGQWYKGERPEGLIIHEPAGVKLCKNKYRMKICFRDNNISSPKFWRNFPKGFRGSLVRKIEKHSQGRGMKLLRVYKEEDIPKTLKDNVYYEEYVICAEEYRVHVMDDRIFHTDLKVLRPGHRPSWVRNLEDYHYKKVDFRQVFTSDQANMIVDSVRVLGFTFAAVDVGKTNDGKIYIFEANSAPGMRTIIRRKYNQELIKYILKQGLKAKE